MRRAAGAAVWFLPPLACLLLYWPAIDAWFQADDFAWLGLGLEIHDWRTLAAALFEPRAQGTVRVWSERLYFLAFYQVFGLEPLPFHLWAFLTQCANFALLAAITRRLTGSRAAGVLAALLWTANSAFANVIGWSSAYNQALCGFFVLLAFYFLLLYLDTGKRRFEAAQWAAFLLGFGAQEAIVVYPALAAGYTCLFARTRFRRTLPLFVPSLLFGAWHLTKGSEGGAPYVMHFTSGMLRTLGIYWSWTTGPAWLLTPGLPDGVVIASMAVVSAALLGFAAWRIAHGDRVPLFLLWWFAALIGPVLPLRDHLTEYYTYLPSAGVAMLGGTALVWAWRQRPAWLAVAVAYAAICVPAARASSAWLHARGERVEKLVRGVAAARQLHPFKVILLDGVEPDLFWAGVLDRPFRLYNARVFLTPGSEQRIPPKPGYGDPAEYVLPPEATERALDDGAVAVYDVRGARLRNITTLYGSLYQYRGKTTTPRRVDVANPLLAYLVGAGWHNPDGNIRWMARRASLRIGGPPSAAGRLLLRGICAPQLSASGPVEVAVAVDGIELPRARIAAGQTAYEFDLPLPAELAGRRSVEVTVDAGRTVTPSGDRRDLSLAFGVFEVK
ncbi:MAG: hypothetical protein ACE15B_17000 [Bryobacteraceae bacterium]